MEAWWSTLNEPLRWFYAIAISTSLLMVVQLVLMVLGVDAEDLDDGTDLADCDIHVISVRTINAFFAGFGWTGVAALESGASLPLALVLAVAVGGAFMGGVLLLMRTLYSMRHSGTLDYNNAIGQIGSAYVPIPPTMSDSGQVQVKVQGRLIVAQAFTRSAVAIPTRAPIRVIELLDQNTLVVEPLDDLSAPTPGAPGED